MSNVYQAISDYRAQQKQRARLLFAWSIAGGSIALLLSTYLPHLLQ
jgi:hypothetical protein